MDQNDVIMSIKYFNSFKQNNLFSFDYFGIIYGCFN